MKALHKEFLMEIRKSKARFISIFFIVALGVAFFSGIQASSPDMRYSGDAYYDENTLMDLKVMGTLGLTDEDVKALQELDGVELAEGAYSTDAMCGEGEKQKVLHVESLNQEVNKITPSEGRIPENSGEIFLDSAFASSQGYEVGDKISLREEADKELLVKNDYTVVGVGNSPLYISFNRGNTTLGTGEVNGFAYILPEDFNQEIYTQIYVLVHGAKGLTSYNDSYDNLIRKISDRVEEIADVRCEARFAEVKSDAQEEIDDARKELEDGKKEADEKLADAEKELRDGEKELEDGKKEYEDGKQQLADAKKELEDGKQQLADAKKEVSDGWSQISSAKAQVAGAQSKLQSAQAEVDSGWAEVNSNQKTLDSSAKKLEKAKKELSDGLAQIEQAKATLNEKQSTLDASKAEIASGREQIESTRNELNIQRQQCEDGLTEVAAGEAQLPAAEAALAQAKEQLNSLIAQKDSAKAQYEAAVNSGIASQEELDALAAQVAALEEQTAQVQAQVNESAAALESSRQQLAATRSELESGIASIDAGLSELTQKEAELNAAETQIAEGQTQINQGWEELKAQEAKLAPAREEIAKGEKELKSGQAQIDAGKQKLQSAQAEINSSASQLAGAQAEIDSNVQKLVNGEQEIKDNEKKLTDGEKEIQDNEKKLADAKKEIEDGEKELKDGRKEYEDARKEAEEEIAENEQKLADAQKELDELEEPEWMVTNRNDLPEYSDYGDNADRIKNLGQVFPVIFFLVAALISLTTMTRMVEEQRTQIGTMKALGYGKGAIAYKYIGYAYLATVGGSILGILIGENIIPYIIINGYGIMYHNVSNSLVMDYEWKYALIASGAAVVCTVGATLFSIGKELRETPASLMRPPAPKEGKRVLIERIPFLWKHLSFTWKSTMRNLFRYKKRLFMTIFGIAGSMGLMLVGFGLQDSILDIATLQYSNLQHYEANVIEDEDATSEEKEEVYQFLKAQDKVERSSKVQMTKMTVPRGSSNISVYVYVPESLENFKEDVTLQNRVTGEKYELTDEGAVICEKTADLLNIGVGDEITLKKSDKEYAVKVAAVTENYMSHFVYMTPAVYEETFHEAPEYGNIVFTMKEEYKDELGTVGTDVLSYPGALSISYTSSLAGQLERMLSTLGMVVIVLIVSAGMLAFVVLYNLNNINITERQRELATLKVLGFYDSEVSQYVFRENILLTIIGVLCGGGFGIFLHRYVITTVEVDAVMFGRNIKPMSFVISGLITCGFSLFVNITMHFKLKKVDMVESLKSVE